jgi:hypothetical protein
MESKFLYLIQSTEADQQYSTLGFVIAKSKSIRTMSWEEESFIKDSNSKKERREGRKEGRKKTHSLVKRSEGTLGL